MSHGLKFVSPSELVKSIKGFRTVSSSLFSSRTGIQLDSVVFRLHSLITVTILLTGTMFLTMRQYFGEPIECLHDNKPASKMLQHFCWMEGTFSIIPKKLVNRGHHYQAYHGVQAETPNDEIVYHRYYQWGYFVLIIQSILFYLPRYLWKLKENERLHDVIKDLLKGHIASFADGERVRIIQDLADAMYVGSSYFRWFFLLEIYCLLHLGVQIWFTNVFLGGGFLKLGFEWVFHAHTTSDYYHDPLITLFPRIAKCCWHQYGMSGSVQTQDMLCYMPMNIVFEKLYVILWFWFTFLFSFTTFFLGYRFLLFFPWFRFFKLSSIVPSSDRHTLRKLCKDIGQWFILENVAVNLKTAHFVDVVEELMNVHFDKKGRPTYRSTLRESIQKGTYVPGPAKKSDKKKSKSSKSDKNTVGWNNTSSGWNDSKCDNQSNWDNNQTDNWETADSNTNTNTVTQDWGNSEQVDWPEN